MLANATVIKAKQGQIRKYNGVTWSPWRLKSLATRLLVQQIVKSNKTKKALKLRTTGSLLEESTSDW